MNTPHSNLTQLQKPAKTSPRKLIELHTLPKKGDNLGDIHRGIPTLKWQGIEAHSQKVPVPVELAAHLLQNACASYGYLNKTLVVVGQGNPSEGEALLTCAYIYDATVAALVTYDFR